MVDALATLPLDRVKTVVEDILLGSELDSLDIKEFGQHLVDMVRVGNDIVTEPDDWDFEDAGLDECDCDECINDCEECDSCDVEEDNGFYNGYETSFADLTQEEFDAMYQKLEEDPEPKFPVRLTCEDDDPDPIDLELDIDTLNHIFEISNQKNCSINDAFCELIKDALDHLKEPEPIV